MLKFTASLLTAIALATPAGAVTTVRGIPNSHRDLVQAISDVGGYSYVNPEYFCGDANAPDGLYTWNDSQETALVVCQDNATGEREVAWTANDLDTLRHEAWHMIQDCIYDERGDTNLHPLSYSKEYIDMLISTAVDVLGEERVKSIAFSYKSNGADEKTIIMEIEAFLVAATVSPDMLAVKLRNSCGVR